MTNEVTQREMPFATLLCEFKTGIFNDEYMPALAQFVQSKDQKISDNTDFNTVPLALDRAIPTDSYS